MSSFDERCYELLLKVPEGKVTTYQSIARALGTTAYRAVGNAMNRNPDAPRVPCHRVVRSNGELGGYAFGVEKKASMLRSEGIAIENGKVRELQSCLYKFR